MDGRERLLTALDGGQPDRVPRALSFYRVDLERIVPPSRWRPDLVDVRFVRFAPSPEERRLQAAAQPHEPDTRLGTPDQRHDPSTTCAAFRSPT